MSSIEPESPSAEQPRSRAERLRILRDKRYEEWWSIVFCGPIALYLCSFITEIRWLTPNHLTLLSAACKLAVVPLFFAGSPEADIAAVILMQVNLILDCMDGALARYRKTSTVFGAFLDKVTDAVGFILVMGAFGLRAYYDSGDLVAMLLLFGAIGGLIARFYAHWVVAYFEQQSSMPEPQAGEAAQLSLGELSLGGQLLYYLKSTPRLLLFSEGDLYFWMGVGLLFGITREISYLMGGMVSLWSIVILVYWGVRTRAIDAYVARKKEDP